MSKLLAEADLSIYRLRHQGSTHYFITPNEMRTTIAAVGEVAYCLYSYYRTGFFTESADIDDSNVGLQIGWPDTKVKRYRLILEKADLFLTKRHGTKADGNTKVFVGADTVALYKAGLPANIIDSKAFNKLKRAFKINCTEDLLVNVNLMADEYARNPELYK